MNEKSFCMLLHLSQLAGMAINGSRSSLAYLHVSH